MKFRFKLEHIRGKYLLLAAVIPTAISIFLASNEKPAKTNQVNIKENSNSPIVSEVKEQNIYYYPQPAKDSIPMMVESPNSTQTSTKKKKVQSGDKTESKDTVFIQNALIITENQSGGTNNVNIQQIPEPQVKLKKVNFSNEVTTLIQGDLFSKPVPLPTQEHPYDSVYKTQFTINYSCPVNLNNIAIIIRRTDVLSYYVTHTGITRAGYGTQRSTQFPTYVIHQPENGDYTFTVYSINELGNPLKELHVIKNIGQ